jgi:hypothetical protein
LEQAKPVLQAQRQSRILCQSAKLTQTRASPTQTALRISYHPPDILVLVIKKEEAPAKTGASLINHNPKPFRNYILTSNPFRWNILRKITQAKPFRCSILVIYGGEGVG